MPKNKKSKKKSLLHVGLNYSEAKEGKKNLLSAEFNLLKSSQHFSEYKELRIKELNKKKEIMKKINEIKADTNRLISKLPKLKIPKSLNKEGKRQNQEIENLIKPVKKEKIDSQLVQIQKKLRALER